MQRVNQNVRYLVMDYICNIPPEQPFNEFDIVSFYELPEKVNLALINRILNQLANDGEITKDSMIVADTEDSVDKLINIFVKL